jgi:hypothetical protein
MIDDSIDKLKYTPENACIIREFTVLEPSIDFKADYELLALSDFLLNLVNSNQDVPAYLRNNKI